MLLLGEGFPIDLRNYVRAGDAVSLRDARLRSSAMVADAADAIVWEADAPPGVSSGMQVAANLCAARAGIAAWVERRPSVLQREARATCESLERACRFCDVDHALRDATRLIGWGEGLTPAGDDFLVGLMAGLDALASGHGARSDFLRRLGAAMVDGAVLTTPVSAYYLRLAACGHFNASVHRLRAALLSAHVTAEVRRVVDNTLRLGATSGADLSAGMLAGIAAWCTEIAPS